jgi:hypothetical protein
VKFTKLDPPTIHHRSSDTFLSKFDGKVTESRTIIALSEFLPPTFYTSNLGFILLVVPAYPLLDI